MFCYQCQETANCTGCTLTGVCGKNPQVAAAQDLLVYVTKGYCEVTTKLRKEGTNISDAENRMVVMNLFMTITNANFDKEAIENRIHDTLHVKKELLKKVKDTSGLSEAALWDGSGDWEVIAGKVGVLSNPDEDIRSLQQLITYGIKGLCAYTKHANALMHTDPKLDAFIQETLAKTLDNSLSAEELVALTLKTGEYGVKGMAMLDAANTGAYGDPEITAVNIGVRKNPGILVSGHDLRDLEMLLEQTKGTCVDVYTHSEMLPACSYPAFKKYPHFVGNYGNAWWQQKEEFESFNGPILMTTNCIVPPKELEFGTIPGGFAHAQVIALSDKVVAAVKSGKIKKFVVMAGCDGRMKSREYYTEFAKALPKDTVILTAGCAKYRYNKLKLGDIDGIPRILDAGQCNDSYSLAVIAMKLKEVFGLDDINDLPIIYNIAWYEQKAVIVFLALLSLGIKNIHLGPTLPAFLSPAVLKVLVEKFHIAGITTVEEDMKLFFG